MMVAQRSSALPYESLPTEDGGAPTSFTYRDGDSHAPRVTHHPIPMGVHHPDRSTWITCTLVTVLVVLASILGVIVGFASQRAHYPAIYNLAEGNTPSVGASGGEAHGSGGGGYAGYESESSSERSGDPWSSNHGEGVGDSSYSWESSGDSTTASHSGSTESYDHSGEEVSSTEYGSRTQTPGSSETDSKKYASTESGQSTATKSTSTAATVAVIATTQATTLPPTTRTTTTTTTTTTAPASTTTSPVPVTTATMLSAGENASVSSSGNTEGSAGTSSDNVVTDGYNSDLGVVDYMVVMQKKFPVGLVLVILLGVILVTVGLLAAIIYVVKRKTTKTRRRAHVRRAINELRAQDKSNLLQSDEEEG